jgi:hypothetical protein
MRTKQVLFDTANQDLCEATDLRMTWEDTLGFHGCFDLQIYLTDEFAPHGNFGWRTWVML